MPILKTTNAGSNWTLLASGATVRLKGVHFSDVNKNNGWIVGRAGLVLSTKNGGTDWQLQNSHTDYGLNDIFFTDAQTGWTVGDKQTILHTTNGGLTFVEGERPSGVPSNFSLLQNYPNPFNPSSTIRYGLPHTSFVTLTVYNTLGQQVAQLVNEQQQAGYHDVVFRSDGLASGVYFYRLTAGSFVETGSSCCCART